MPPSVIFSDRRSSPSPSASKSDARSFSSNSCARRVPIRSVATAGAQSYGVLQGTVAQSRPQTAALSDSFAGAALRRQRTSLARRSPARGALDLL